MRIFVTGATGVIGRRVLPSLLAKGHAVIALSRSDQNSEWLARHGAEAKRADLFDADQMTEASAGCQAILHLATAIPSKTRATKADWAANDRIRREGTAALIEASLHNRCLLFLQQSITFLYGDRNGDWVDETATIPARQPSFLRSAFEMESMIMTAVKERGLPGTILRFGMFYAHDSVQTAGLLSGIRAGKFPLLGNGSTYWNMVNIDDAASAVVAATKESPPGIGQILNICDDTPVRSRDLMHFLAEELQAKPPRSIPLFLAKLILGSDLTRVLTASVRCRNDKAKHTLGWLPRYQDFRTGFKEEIKRWKSQ